MNRRMLIATAVIPAVLGNARLDRSCLADEARPTSQIVAQADDIATAKNPMDRSAGETSTPCGWIGVGVSPMTRVC